MILFRTTSIYGPLGLATHVPTIGPYDSSAWSVYNDCEIPVKVNIEITQKLILKNRLPMVTAGGWDTVSRVIARVWDTVLRVTAEGWDAVSRVTAEYWDVVTRLTAGSWEQFLG